MRHLFADWLAPIPVDRFVGACFKPGKPWARPGAASSAIPLLRWETLDRILRSRGPIDVLTVAGGRLVDVPAPRSFADVRRGMDAGVSTVVRSSELHDPGLAALAASFGACFPGEVHVQVYATPGGTNSYGWHYDFEDVFIAQTEGIKEYNFRDNTVARHTRLGETLDFSAVREERSPRMASTLIAGDWLYIPRRWWHFVECTVDSLSISVGVMPADAIREAVRVPPGWTALPREWPAR